MSLRDAESVPLVFPIVTLPSVHMAQSLGSASFVGLKEVETGKAFDIEVYMGFVKETLIP